MKIRSGFVANSSSSSFIVTCSKVPENHHEAREILFGERKKWIPEIVSKFIFSELRTFEFDPEKVKELLTLYSFTDLDHCSNVKLPECNEIDFIKECHSEFWYQETFGETLINGFCIPSNTYSWLEDEFSVEEIVKMKYEEKERHFETYFALEETNERFKNFVESKLWDLTSTYPQIENPVFMQCEIEDHSEIGSEVEHNSTYWEKMHGYVRFNHH